MIAMEMDRWDCQVARSAVSEYDISIHYTSLSSLISISKHDPRQKEVGVSEGLNAQLCQMELQIVGDMYFKVVQTTPPQQLMRPHILLMRRGCVAAEKTYYCVNASHFPVRSVFSCIFPTS